MIIRNTSKASLLTGEKVAGQPPAIAHDRPDPTRRVGSENQQRAIPDDHEHRMSKFRDS
jgi:hypothetical protein